MIIEDVVFYRVRQIVETRGIAKARLVFKPSGLVEKPGTHSSPERKQLYGVSNDTKKFSWHNENLEQGFD
jgi:hypothetical protein